jgi:uncharacterized protein YecE (DUF72 family)
MKRLWIGCSGWAYDDWREPVYGGLPRRLWLERYAELFDTVEVNATFYRLPERKTVAGWAEQTPDGFLFACKASRYLTHIKRLKGAREGWRRFAERLEPLAEAGKLGPVLWQLPGNFERDDARLEELIAALPESRHAIEFRHPSWFAESVLRALAEADVALVIGDDPQRPFVPRKVPARWAYVRFHRGSRGRRGNYSDAEIAEWRRRVAAWRAHKDVFVYFNNDWEAFAPRNASKLAGRRLPAPKR